MYRENYIRSLRTELLSLVEDYLTPIALQYGYSETPLETNIKWRPLVLVLGNYSSGKSTLINEFLDADIQGTGQAPTDDSFTIITYDDEQDNGSRIRLTEERDGKFLLNDPEYPFESLKKHGQRFISHFKLKKVNAPFLRTLSIIDTPGMLDSITERDRGYSYQDVIGDLAQIADLVLVLFDPHKAGTVREAHTSLRDTLPAKTFEDRVLFVLNRIDECASLTDLLRVYGTLCWNLSQMTGRKDIPMIHLTYSQRAAGSDVAQGDSGYLYYLENQREELKAAILQAPRHRLDNLAAFVEIHSERLTHLLEALTNYRRILGRFRFKFFATGFLLSALAGAGATLFALSNPILSSFEQNYLIGGGGGVGLLVFFFWGTVLRRVFTRRFNRKQLAEVDSLTTIENQTRRDSWYSIKDYVYGYMRKTGGDFSLRQIRQEYRATRGVFEKGSKEIREALNELATIRHDENPTDVDPDKLTPAFMREP
ncbi:MAG: Dynamin family protein [Desulfobacterales bacterium]|nr:Dynamin family protein [Desulfobacterales bacterium]